MEAKATHPHEKIAHEADQEDSIVSMVQTVLNANVGKVEEERIGDGVDYFGGVLSCIIVLG